MRQKKPAALCSAAGPNPFNAGSVAVDGLDDARHRPCRFEAAAHLLEDRVDVFLLRLNGGLADNLHDLIAAILQLLENIGCRLCGRLLEVMHQNDAFACFSSFFITDWTTCSGLRILKSKESMSVEKMPTLRSPRYFTSSGGCRSAGKRKKGPTGLLPSAMLTAAKPFSISSLPSCSFTFDRSLCDQVCEPTVWPAAATCFMISGCHPACLPIGKNTALVH